MGRMSRQDGNFQARTAAGGGVIANASTGCGAFLMQNTADGFITVKINATLGSLTNWTATPMGSDDGTNYYTITDPGALGTIAASGKFGFTVNAKGWKYFQLFLSSTGTTTGSSADVRYSYQSGF